jgi:uncharacterized protein (DUF608 family)
MQARERVFTGRQLDRVAFPMGGIGAGTICLEGTGGLSHVSLRHRPNVYNEPTAFAALHIEGTKTARVLEGRVPEWKLFFPWENGFGASGNGLPGKTYGLPRFEKCSFAARFPFGRIKLADRTMPVQVEITGWSPFTPGDADDSSLPVAALEYTFRNVTRKPARAVFSFHAANFMAPREKDRPPQAPNPCVRPTDEGFVLEQAAWDGCAHAAGSFAAFVLDEKAAVDCAWFRGGWWDPLTMVWNAVAAGQAVHRLPHAEGEPGRGGSLYVPFTLKPGAEHTIRLLLAWYVPHSDISAGKCAPTPDGQPCACQPPTYQPWYARRFRSMDEVVEFWRDEYDDLRDETERFTNCFYDTTLPAEAVEAVAANLAILKSPTCLRQADGRFWAWEGCCDNSGCCHGTCTHVWNYAQAMPHLFPALERTLRETEFVASQDERGHQNFRATLPIQPTNHDFHAAADGQFGGVVKVYRDWRISGDTPWMRSLWPAVRRSLEYGIATWDPDRTGTLLEPHHNTYDIEFWGADGMCTSFYLAALQAGVAMGRACGDDVAPFEALLAKGKAAMERDLWNGEYFFQKVQWQGLRAADPTYISGIGKAYSAEARALLQQEGPKYQYGTGCLSDGVLGDWLARVAGLPPVLDPQKVAKHVVAVFEHNFRKDLSSHANPQRPGYAANDEAGLLACSWPRGGKLALPFPYSDEVWTGMEYHVAAHLILFGRIAKGLTIVRAARSRYDGRVRNPFNEYECGHWYARAMSSYSLLQALGGACYDAVTQTLTLAPAVKGDYRAFLCTATGYGTVGLRKGVPFVEVKGGRIPVAKFVVQPAGKR